MDDTEKLQTEFLRRIEHATINANAAPERAALEAREGQVWTTDELAQAFEVVEFRAPYVVARRRSDGALGSLRFQHHPRFYFAWKEDAS